MKDGIPDAVAEQAAAADAAMEAAAQTAVATAVGPPQPPAQPGVDTGNQPPDPSLAPPQDGMVMTLEDLSGSAPVGATPAPTSTTPQQQIEQANQRWRTAQGMITAKDRELATMREELERTKQAAPPVAAAATPTDAFKSYLSEDERDDYESEEEALGVAGRAARGVFEAQIAALRSELGTRLDSIEQFSLQAQETVLEDQTWGAVEALSPGAKDINNGSNATWIEFLSGPNPHNPAQTLRDLAQSRYQSGDVEGLASLVDSYKRQYGWTTDSTGAPNSTALNGQLKPSRAGGTPAPMGQQKTFIPESEIARFYGARTRGEYDGRDEEVKKIEAAIEEAERENRILIGQ